MQPEVFGKYTLLSRLGSGGMAEVFLARTRSVAGFEKLLAIKRLLPFCTEDQETVDLLADEARITVRLTHPNIVQVFDFGRVQDTYYIAMEYVDGLDLKSLIRIDELSSTPMELGLALHVTCCILEALDFAHNQCDERQNPLGIIHRDVSPHNVLVSRHGHVKLTDFGVARAAISSHVSRVGDIRGKFSYMPPEQVYGAVIDQRIDVFAAGAIFYELLSGRPPYRACTAAEQLELLQREVGPPSALRPDLPVELDEICMRALARDPEQRFESAAEFAFALREQAPLFKSSLPPTVRLASLVERRRAELAAEAEAAGQPEDDELMGLSDFSVDQDSLIRDPIRSDRWQEGRRRRSSARPPASPPLSLGAEASAPALLAAPTELEAAPFGLRIGAAPGLDEAATLVSLRPPPPPQDPGLAGPALDDMRTLVADSPFATPDEERPATGELQPARAPRQHRKSWTQLVILLVITLAVGLAVGVWLATC